MCTLTASFQSLHSCNSCFKYPWACKLVNRLILTKERPLLQRCQNEKPSRINDIYNAVVNEIHVVSFRARFEHLLEVLVDLHMQAAHDLCDKPLVFLDIRWLEQSILDKKCLEALNFVFLSCVDELNAKLGRHFLKYLVLESRFSGVDVFLSCLVEYTVEVFTLVQLTHSKEFNLADNLL